MNARLPNQLVLPALTIDGLEIRYTVRGIERTVIRDLSLRIAPGEIYGMVGESGSGKSTVAFAIERYLPENGRVAGGSIALGEHDVLNASKRQLRRLRSSAMAMVYQDPSQALNPTMTIGRQLIEAFRAATLRDTSPEQAAHRMLERVQIADPARAMRSYPHQLSGGMQQRVVIAMALACRPSLLILDEPTTGLDASVEAEVLALIASLRAKLGIAVLLISHNLSAIRKLCDRIGVLYAGTLVEEAHTTALLDRPRHPYTIGLLECLPGAGRTKQDGPLASLAGGPPASVAQHGCAFAARCAHADKQCETHTPLPQRDGSHVVYCHHPRDVTRDTATIESRPLPAPRSSDAGHAQAAPLLVVEHLSKTYSSKGRSVAALRDVSFSLCAGETLGLIGESGSGKSTLARIIAGLVEPDSGSRIELAGAPLEFKVRRRGKHAHRALQMVFQDPGSALNRAHRVGSLIDRALKLFTTMTAPQRQHEVDAIGTRFRLSAAHLASKPARLSGGLRQRAAIARAFAGRPGLVICDEPTSALDASVQAAILNLLVEQQRAEHTAYLFISHDLNVVRYVADRIVVLYRGEVVQTGTADQVFGDVQHPYTRALLDATQARPDAVQAAVFAPAIAVASTPSTVAGCAYRAQCPHAVSRCEHEAPLLRRLASGQAIRCHQPPI
ncbi:ABC transporter ATP-binding protein [Paraburkholderia xenovorans]|uniref:dipeptide ABC transporter ATP-binding protein n=1 Tax=Paraburkholderia xenovorans TaxID=36873 RepID=UPI0038BCFC50